jgi:signal transduction histidine kinase
VIINLLENAFKFTPEGGTIDLRLERQENEVVLTVSDSGIGIPLEDVPYLFKRFHRARNASGYPGNGLGLAIVEAIVRGHRGTVLVQSQEKHGTIISTKFPVSKDS